MAKKTTSPKKPAPNKASEAAAANEARLTNIEQRMAQLTGSAQQGFQQQNAMLAQMGKSLQSIMPGNVRMNAAGMAIELIKANLNRPGQESVKFSAADMVAMAKEIALFLEPPPVQHAPAPMATPAAQA